MSTLIHWQLDTREFRYNHTTQDPDRSRRTRKPNYSRFTGRIGLLTGFHRRRLKRSF